VSISLSSAISVGDRFGYIKAGAVGGVILGPGGVVVGYISARALALHSIHEVIQAIEKEMEKNGCN